MALAIRHRTKILYRGSRLLLTKGMPHRAIYFGQSPGDDLLCTAIFHELRKRGERGLWFLSKNEALLRGNSDIDVVIPPDEVSRALIRRLNTKILNPTYTVNRDWENDFDPVPEAHIIALMCKAAQITGEISLKPYYYIQNQERTFGSVFSSQIAIQTSGLAGRTPMRNKEWVTERYQQTVNLLKKDFGFVQVGSDSDPPLDGVKDLRGKTTLRELASVLHNSQMFVGQVGFAMHLARAVETRSVIIYGGREHPWQSGYRCNENIYRILPCAPCWRWNTCDHERICMTSIHAEEVVNSVFNLVKRLEIPLESDKVDLPANSEEPITTLSGY